MFGTGVKEGTLRTTPNFLHNKVRDQGKTLGIFSSFLINHCKFGRITDALLNQITRNLSVWTV